MKNLVSTCLLAFFFGARLLAGEEKVLLKTEIPAPPLMSGCLVVTDTNLEPLQVLGKREFYVPVGTTNLALRKPVTASCRATVGNLAMITDGDKNWKDGSWMELEAGKQWVQIDLEHPAEIYAVLVWHYYHQSRVYFDVVAAVSDDPEFKNDVRVIFNNDIENTLGLGKGSDHNYVETYLGKWIDAKGVKGRYLRLYSNGNTVNLQNHYVEVEVFGKAVNK